MPLRRRGALGALALLAACRSPEPVLYTLVAVPGTPRRGRPRSVAVRDATIAGYLDRLPIVRSAESYRLEVSGNDWWGEPLAGMLTRVLVEDLAQRLPGSSVFASGGAISAPAEAVVEVSLLRLGLGAPDTLVLTAQLAVSRKEPRGAVATRTESVTVPVAGGRTQDFVAAASAAVGRLADAAAAMLAG